jgi:hypothetical protein
MRHSGGERILGKEIARGGFARPAAMPQQRSQGQATDASPHRTEEVTPSGEQLLFEERIQGWDPPVTGT